MTCMEKEHIDDERSYERASSSCGKNTLDELSFSHIFDYNAIEQIANGLEKMVQSWSSAQEERAHEYARVSVSLDDDSSAKPEVSVDLASSDAPAAPHPAAAKPLRNLGSGLFERKPCTPLKQKKLARSGPQLSNSKSEVTGFSWDIHKPGERIKSLLLGSRRSISPPKRGSELLVKNLQQACSSIEELKNSRLSSWDTHRTNEKINSFLAGRSSSPKRSPRKSPEPVRSQEFEKVPAGKTSPVRSPRNAANSPRSPGEKSRSKSPVRSPRLVSINYPKPCFSPEKKNISVRSNNISPKRSPELGYAARQRASSPARDNNINSNVSSPRRSLREPRSLRESMEMKNSSTLISTSRSHPHDVEELESNVFPVDDLAELADETTGKNENNRQARDTFLTSSSYWCVEPEALMRKEDSQAEKQQDCSFISEASYEKADFNTSYEERPLKRKKEAPEMIRNSGYEYEYEAAAVEDVEPCMSETLTLDECYEQAPERRFTAFARNLSNQESDDTKEAYKSKVEELQIALLECAAEYEVKMVEMEMKLLQMKSKNQHLEQEAPQLAKNEKPHEWSTKRLENYRKQNLKLQREKEVLSRDLVELRKKEKQLDLLRKNLEDSLQKVNCLQRELAKKEEELVDSQLKEKESKAQLYQVEAALQQAEASQIEQGCVLNLLSALSQWLQNIKKASFVKFDPRHQLQVQQYEETLSKLMDEFVPQKALQKLAPPPLGFVGYLEDASSPAESEISFSENNNNKRDKEVQALQNELEKLACRRSTF